MAARWKTGSNEQIYRRYLQTIGGLYGRRQDVRIFTEVLLTLAGISLFGAFAIRPTLVTISRLWSEIKEKEQIIAKMDEKIGNLNRAQSVYSQQKQNIDILNQAMPEKPSPEEVMKQVFGIAQKDSVSIFNEDIGKTVLKGEQDIPETKAETNNNKDVISIPADSFSYNISFSARGDYGQLMTFLRDIEKMRRPIYLDKTDFVVISELDQKILQLNIEGRVLFYVSK